LFEKYDIDKIIKQYIRVYCVLISNIFLRKKSFSNSIMPPKKAAPKGAKGKAKAQDKEEKKVTKVAKTAVKRKCLPPL
jgi:hypothetical protein